MFVKKLSLCLCVISFFSFNQADAGFREDLVGAGLREEQVDTDLRRELSKKKYAFSEVVLDEHLAFLYVLGKAETNKVAEEAFLLMWEDAKFGNEKVQKKLFTLFSTPAFYDKAKARVSLLKDTDIYSLNALIDMGVVQEKTWVFYEKAMREKDQKKKFIFLNQYINNIYPDGNENNQEYKNVLDEHARLIDSKLVGCLPINVKEKDKKKLKLFIDNNVSLKNSAQLIGCYNYFKDKSPKFSLKCLEEAAKIGSVDANLRFSQHYERLGKRDLCIHYFRKAAEKGDTTVILSLAWKLHKSQSISDKEEALTLYLKKASEGEFRSIVNLANLLDQLPKNIDREMLRINLLKEAVTMGHVESNVDLAEMYLDGIAGNNSDPMEAYNCLLKAANQNCLDAMYFLGLLLKEGFDGQEPDRIAGNAWITKAANLGFAHAMNHLGGLSVFDGEGSITQKESYEWFLKAAQLGHKPSMTNLAFILWFGCDGVEANEEEALGWISKSVDKDDIDAMVYASIFLSKKAKKESNQVIVQKYLKQSACYLNCLFNIGYFDNFLKVDDDVDFSGYMSPRLRQEALKASCKRVRKNVVSCIIPTPLSWRGSDKLELLYSLGFLYLHGFVDGKKNKKEAFRLLLVAAEYGFLPAMKLVAEMYYCGFKDQKSDHKEAAKWWLGAAESGCSDAMVTYAELLMVDPVFEKNDANRINVLFWLKKAASMGNERSFKHLKLCEKLIEQKDESDSLDVDLSVFDEKVGQFDLDVLDLNLYDFVGNITEIKTNNVLDDADNLKDDEDQLNVVFDEENIIQQNNFSENLSENAENSSPIIDSVEYIKNPKYIRDQLRKIGKLNKKFQKQEDDIRNLEISKNSQLIVDILLDKTIKFKNINYTQLVNLFSDPFFENQVSVIKSKSGCVITAKNYKTLDYVVASTHNKHNKTYDGLNPFFARDLIKILALFGFTEV